MRGHFIDFSARVSLLLALMLVRGNSADDSCRTVSGPDTGSHCMFPFIWGGATYTSCVQSGDGAWCDTRADATSDSGWGVCNDNCTPIMNRPKKECKEELGFAWIEWCDGIDEYDDEYDNCQSNNYEYNDCHVMREPHVLTDHGDWDLWWRFCSGGHYVVGMKVKMQSKQGWTGDDTGLNAIRLICSDGEEIWSLEGEKGEWSEPVMTQNGEAITAVALRSDGDSLTDDAATTGVVFWDASDREYVPAEGHFGEWQISDECPDNTAIFGFMTQVEGYNKRRLMDNTALNRVRFLCR